MILSKKQFEVVEDFLTETVDMQAEWGGDILIRSMSIGQNVAITKNENPEDFALDLIMASCINEDGSLFFNDPENDRIALLAKNPTHIKKLLKAVEKINNLVPDAVENLAKN